MGCFERLSSDGELSWTKDMKLGSSTP